MRLRKNEYCPIHRSLFCCSSEQSKKERRLRFGVQRIEDPHHPRGYRELRSPIRDAQGAQPEGCRAGREMRNLPRSIYRLQRGRFRPHRARITSKPCIDGAMDREDRRARRRTLIRLSARLPRLANDPPAQPLECSQIVRHPSYAPRLHLRVHHSAIPAT